MAFMWPLVRLLLWYASMQHLW